MTKNLEAADHIVKLVLAICTIGLYLAGVIAGPFAVALVVLSLIILIVFAVRLFLSDTQQTKKYHISKENQFR